MTVIHSDELLKTADGSYTLRDSVTGQSYHSFCGAKREARELYIDGSHFVQALQQQERVLYVLDVGLGLGYNALTTIDAWLKCPKPASIKIVSLENEIDLLLALKSASAVWQQGWEESWLETCRNIRLVNETNYSVELKHPSGAVCQWEIHIDDARQALQKIDYKFDYIWQDPFSPEKNPNMWNQDWFSQLIKNTHPSTQLYTYSVARVVKDALEVSGWIYERIVATTNKRHWLKASPFEL